MSLYGIPLKSHWTKSAGKLYIYRKSFFLWTHSVSQVTVTPPPPPTSFSFPPSATLWQCAAASSYKENALFTTSGASSFTMSSAPPSFPNRLIGTRAAIVIDPGAILQSPKQLRAQIMWLLKFIKCHKWFLCASSSTAVRV